MGLTGTLLLCLSALAAAQASVFNRTRFYEEMPPEDSVNSRWVKFLNRATCGQANRDEKIVNGEQSEAHQWPWMVNILYSGSFHLCGGSLYNNDYVITAAHCFPSSLRKNKFTLVLGDHYAWTTEAGQQSRKIASVKVHEHFDMQTMDNDIAILKLSAPVEYSETISPICLPESGVVGGEEVTVAGWGETEGTMNEAYLNQATVPVIPSSTCTKPGWYGSKITENMICAGYAEGGIDSCQGDSGGPLVRNLGDRYVLQGVVSWGIGCAEPKSPGVYTNVFNYISWIQANTV